MSSTIQTKENNIKEEIDYKKIGLKVGLEIHQQLNTLHKLFCNCPTTLSDEYKFTLDRYLRPVSSELGEIDIAALFEWEKGKKYVYQVSSSSCLVECDEEPPHLINDETLEIALAISMGLHSTIVDEVYVMRKIVIDGSNTSGFQRTAIVALGGYVEDGNEKIGIQTIAVEEDAARKIEERPDHTTYNLDRLGIPLIEISTSPDIHDPAQAARVALNIGQLLRLTKKVKRGLGTIRQDINVSIAEGTKTEIKGVQDLDLIPLIVKNEALRQLRLLEIKEELRKRGLSKDFVTQNMRFKDLTHIFEKTDSKLVKKELEKGSLVYGIKVPGFAKLLGRELMPNRRFGTEIADYVRALAGLGGIFHSDELPNYGISHDEVNKVKIELGVSDSDAFILIVTPKSKLEKAIDVIKNRIFAAFDGVPKETRAAQDDGTTKFTRPQPGAARMYPETDIPPRRIDFELLERAKKLVPETPEVKFKKLIEMGLSQELANQILMSINLALFEELVEKYSPKVPPVFIASTLENTLKYVKSKGGNISIVTDDILDILLREIYSGNITKDAIEEILLEFTTAKNPNLNEILSKYKAIPDSELAKIIKDTISTIPQDILKNKNKAFNVIMGKVMSKVRGKVDGKKVAELIREELDKI